MSSFEIFWLKSCANQRIPSEYAEKWLKSIQTKYNTESSRIYHNSNVLIKKCDFLDSLCASNSIAKFDDYLIFAIAFQYYHFDLKTDYVDRNCIAFREMCDDASVSDVSWIVIVITLWLLFTWCLLIYTMLLLSYLIRCLFILRIGACTDRHSSLIPYVTCWAIRLNYTLEMNTM